MYMEKSKEFWIGFRDFSTEGLLDLLSCYVGLCGEKQRVLGGIKKRVCSGCSVLNMENGK